MGTRVLEYEARARFDAGRFVGRYLQVLAGLMIALMIVGAVFFDALNVDLTPLLMLWAAGPLKRHSAIARRWVIGIGALNIGFWCSCWCGRCWPVPRGLS